METKKKSNLKRDRKLMAIELIKRTQESIDRSYRKKIPKNFQQTIDHTEIYKSLLAKRNKCDPLNPIEGKCNPKDCNRFFTCAKKELQYFAQIPHWLIDNYLPLLTASEWKVFSYLSRAAKFARSEADWGRCGLTYETISKATGLGKSEIGRYLKKLNGLNLIKHRQVRGREGKGFFTINVITVNHVKTIWSLNKMIEKKEGELWDEY